MTWISYLFLTFLSPTGYTVSATANLYLYGSILISFIVSLMHSKQEAQVQSASSFFPVDKVLIAISTITAIGLALHLYDKIFIMNIDYTSGICSAKLQWLNNGISRQGSISSWQSAFGHILTNFCFITMFFLNFYSERISFKSWCYYSLFTLIVLLIYSASIGNRSILLFYFAYFAAILIARKRILGKLTSISCKRLLTTGLLASLIVFAYFIFIFYDRARCETGQEDILANVSKEKISSYMGSFVEMFGGNIEDSQSSEVKIVNLFRLSALYVTHTQWTFDQVIHSEDNKGSNLINSVIGGLVKIGVLEKAPERSFSSKLLHLPGSIYFSFGLIGLIIYSVLLGLLIIFFETRSSFSDFTTLSLILLYLFILISPLTSAANLMAFPYFAISMGVTYVLLIKFRSRG